MVILAERTLHGPGATVPTREVRPATTPRPADDRGPEGLRRPGVIRMPVRAPPAAVDRLHAERVGVRTEVGVHGRRPLPADHDAGGVRAEPAGPRDRLDTPRKVDRNLEPQA